MSHPTRVNGPKIETNCQYIIKTIDKYDNGHTLILTNDATAAEEIRRSAEYSGEFTTVKAYTKMPRLSEREYLVVPYDDMSSSNQTSYNCFPRLRELFPPASRVTVVSVYNYSGTYRQQNICRVLAVVDNEIADVSWLVKRAVYNKWNSKYFGIQCDTAAFGSDIAYGLGRSLWGEGHALLFYEIG